MRGLNKDEISINWTLNNGQEVTFRPATIRCWAVLLSLAYLLRSMCARELQNNHEHTHEYVLRLNANDFTILRPADAEDSERSCQRLLVELHELETRINVGDNFDISRGMVCSLSSLMNYSFFALEHLLAALLYESASRESVNMAGMNAIGGVDVHRCRLLLADSLPIAR